MSHIQGYFDDNDFETRSKLKPVNVPEFPNAEHKEILPPSVKRFSNTNVSLFPFGHSDKQSLPITIFQEYFKTLHPSEVNSTDAFFKDLGIDTSLANFNYTATAPPHSAKLSYESHNLETKSMFNLHGNTTGDSEYRSNYMGKSSKPRLRRRSGLNAEFRACCLV